MEFDTILRDACKDIEGVQGVSLVGLDGIAITSIVLEGEPDLDGMAAELTTFLKTLRSTASSINGEQVNQIVIYAQDQATLLHGVTSEYFILAMVRRGGMMGKIRFRLTAACLRLREEMS